eukprot:XP_001707194.1 Hypothetical protein GL50803_19062 [Giardia lamblia ATCC 50803]
MAFTFRDAKAANFRHRCEAYQCQTGKGSQPACQIKISDKRQQSNDRHILAHLRQLILLEGLVHPYEVVHFELFQLEVAIDRRKVVLRLETITEAVDLLEHEGVQKGQGRVRRHAVQNLLVLLELGDNRANAIHVGALGEALLVVGVKGPQAGHNLHFCLRSEVFVAEQVKDQHNCHAVSFKVQEVVHGLCCLATDGQ